MSVTLIRKNVFSVASLKTQNSPIRKMEIPQKFHATRWRYLSNAIDFSLSEMANFSKLSLELDFLLNSFYRDFMIQIGICILYFKTNIASTVAK